MAIRQYIGARYVPIFYTNSDGTAEWRPNVQYEPLTIVTYNNNTYTSKSAVPANIGNPSDNPEYWVNTGNYNSQISDLTERVGDVEDATETLEADYSMLTSDVVTIKADGETIEGYDYAGFCGGACFAGRELYAFRAAPAHRTRLGDYGTILFYEREKGNRFTKLPINLSYNSVTYGELRDPNLTVSRDGKRLYISGFTTIDDGDSTHYGYVFCLDETLTQIGVIFVANAVFWGNTLETPTGYLIHASYEGDTISLYRTTSPITGISFSSLSFTKLTPFTLTSGRLYSEGTLGYFNNRLVMIARTGSTYPSEISYTYNLEGTSGWTQSRDINYNLHAPCVMPYSEGAFLIMTGSIIDASITGSATKRAPYLGLISFETTHTSAARVGMEAGGLVVPISEFGDYGGYTTLVRLTNDSFGVMYYQDTDTVNGVKFTIVNLYKSLVNMAYHSVPSVAGVTYFTTDAKTAHSNSLLSWAVEALNSAICNFDFASTTSSSDITDKPTGLQSNFIGRASRVSTQFYVEVEFFSGTTPKKYAITGTATSILGASWTEIY